MLKILTYVSKINKNDKEMKKLYDTCMRNIIFKGNKATTQDRPKRG